MREFGATVWLIILATFASRFTFFMVWPYLAILLHDRFGLNEAEVGLFLFAALSIGILFGFYVGYLSDRIGRRRIILVGLVVSSLSMFTLSVAGSLVVFLIATTGASIARSMVEGPGRALLTDMIESRDAKDLALHMRYFALNVGAAIGPLIGIGIGATGNQTTFAFVGAVYATYFVAAAIIFRIENPLRGSAMGGDLSAFKALKVLRADTAFLLFVLATFSANIAYGQVDAGLVQYLRQQSVAELTALYAHLILVNGMTIVVFQFPLLGLLKSLSPMVRAALGVALFTGGFVGFAIADPHQEWQLLVAMFILSFGEAILFPTLNIIVDRMAPEGLKGTYVGAAGLAIFGFAVAPMVGGYILFVFGGASLWLSMTGLSLLVAVLFALAGRLRPVGEATS